MLYIKLCGSLSPLCDRWRILLGNRPIILEKIGTGCRFLVLTRGYTSVLCRKSIRF